MSDLGGLDNTRAAVGEELTDGEKELMRKLFGNWLVLPDSFKASLADYVSQNSLIPISQVRGFTQFVAQTDKILISASATTTSTSFTDLSTVGPQLGGLSPGQYLFFYGFTGGGLGSGIISYAAPSFNGATPANEDVAEVFSGPGPSFGSYSVMNCVAKTLTESTNTVKLQYMTTSGTSSYGMCWLTALRVGNP